MPQEFHVVRCYSCGLFQVDFVKKSKKWKCKVCGEAQSLKKVFARGSGIDCRKYVQNLNLLKKNAADDDFLNSQTQCPPEYSDDASQNVTSCKIATPKVDGGSKWSQYLSVERGDDDDDDDDDNDMVNYPASKRQSYSSRTKRRFKPYGFGNASAAAESVDRQRNDNCWTLNSEKKSSVSSKASAAFVWKTSNENSSAFNNSQTMSGYNDRKRLPVAAVNCPPAGVQANIHSSAAVKSAAGPPSCQDREKQPPLSAVHRVNRSSKWSQFVEMAHPTDSDDYVVGDSVPDCGGGSSATHCSSINNASSRRFSDLFSDSDGVTYCRNASFSCGGREAIAPRSQLSNVFSVSEELDDVLNM